METDKWGLEGRCPDCFDDIPVDMEEGGECENCGHVFYLKRECPTQEYIDELNGK